MKMKLLAGLTCGVMMLGMAGMAEATLLTIGTATYDGNGNGMVEAFEVYNLNYDLEDHLTWLDYTHGATNWTDQMAWATGLNDIGELTIELSTGWSAVGWDASSVWRLPSEMAQADEMGHLFYSELGKVRYVSNELNTEPPGSDYDFKNLMPSGYWSGDGCEAGANYYEMGIGLVDTQPPNSDDEFGLAVRSGRVTYTIPPPPTPTPEPATMLLMGTGLAGLVGARRKRNKSSVHSRKKQSQ